MKKNHPLLWSDLAHRGKYLKPEDGDYNSAASQHYLLFLGGYKKMGDAELVRLGFQARAVSAAVLVGGLSALVYAVLAHGFPSLACLQVWR
ncbi:MAG: hypothetical protein V4625_05980 [Pseudomonadota bacterium]